MKCSSIFTWMVILLGAISTPCFAEVVGEIPDEASLVPAPTDMENAASDQCSDICCDACSLGCGLLGGLIAPSDHCFDDFISPMSNPVYFEDPRTLTEARLIYLNQRTPPLFGGAVAPANVQLAAMQLSIALNERLSIIARKDGFIMSDHALIRDGWADVTAGLKYNVIRDTCNRRLLSVGAAYEMPVGSGRSQQGNGDGEFHLFMTGAQQLDCGVHWISATGFRIPTEPVAESQSWYWSNHFDKEICPGVYVLTEVNWFHWMKSGGRLALPVEGGDLFNFGSNNVAGNDIVTQAVGLKLKPHCNSEIGLAYEFPLTDRQDVLDNRFTVDWIIRY